MKAYKRLGFTVKRGPGNWIVDGITYKGNKGEAVSAYLKDHCIFEGGAWYYKWEQK
jgi:hypothetical protein